MNMETKTTFSYKLLSFKAEILLKALLIQKTLKGYPSYSYINGAIS